MRITISKGLRSTFNNILENQNIGNVLKTEYHTNFRFYI